MNYYRLGRTGLGVSPVCLGTMGFGPPTRQAQVDEIIRFALDSGVNFIDTANCYDGPNRGEIVQSHSESMLGLALAEGLRDEFVITTKAGVPLKPGPQRRGLSATHLLRELDASLRRLKTDYVDIFMLHWPDAFADIEEVLRAVDTAVRSGRARYFGISNHQGWEVCEYLWQADKRNWPKVAVSEIPLSMLDRRFENDLPFYEKHEIGVTPYRPLQGGLLSGRYKRGKGMVMEEQKELIAGWQFEPDNGTYDQIEQLTAMAEESGVSLPQYALAWDLAQPAVVSVIVGVRAREELKDCLKATQIQIPVEHFAQIDRIAPGPEKPVPRFKRHRVGKPEDKAEELTIRHQGPTKQAEPRG